MSLNSIESSGSGGNFTVLVLNGVFHSCPNRSIQFFAIMIDPTSSSYLGNQYYKKNWEELKIGNISYSFVNPPMTANLPKQAYIEILWTLHNSRRMQQPALIFQRPRIYTAICNIAVYPGPLISGMLDLLTSILPRQQSAHRQSVIEIYHN